MIKEFKKSKSCQFTCEEVSSMHVKAGLGIFSVLLPIALKRLFASLDNYQSASAIAQHSLSKAGC